MPSDVYDDEDGKPSGQPKYSLELLSTGGSRSIDTNMTIIRLQQTIARTLLADFMMLGTSGNQTVGSYALSADKSRIFTLALEGWLASICATVDRHLIKLIYDLNGFDHTSKVKLKHGDVDPADLERLGDFVRNLAQAGATIFPDEKLENHLRVKAGFPLKPEGMESVPGQVDNDGVPAPGDLEDGVIIDE